MSLPPPTQPPAPAPTATAAASPAEPVEHSHALRTLALASLGAFVVFLDTTIVNVAFESIGHSFHTGTDRLAWVLNAYSLVFAAALIPAGRLADRYGRKRLFLVGMLGFALMSALCGLAPSPGVLIGGRALQAGFAALITPTSLALILPAFPPERRPFAIGTWGSMGALAAAVGPTLGALLVQYVDWRWIFLVNVPICGLVVLFGLRTLHEGRDPHAQGLPDPLGVLLIGLTPAALSFAIIEGPSRGWTDARVLGAFALAVLLLPAFLWRCRAVSRPAIDLALFRVRSFRLVNAATLVFSAAFYGTLLSNIIFLQTVWHYDVLRAALATSPGPLVVAVVARVSTRLAHVHGYRPILGIGGACYAGALAIYASSIGTHSAWATHWLPAALLMGVGIGMTLPVQSSAAVRELPPARFAVGSGISASFRQLGAVIGISVYVAMLGTPRTAAAALAANQRVWWLFGALGLAAGLVVWLPRLWTPRPTPSSP